MMSGLSLSWPLQLIDSGLLARIEAGSDTGDEFLASIEREIRHHLQAVTQPEDLEPIRQAYTAYAEAAVYLLLTDKGVALQRTPGTGDLNQQRPDFLHKHQSGEVYFEVKCLDFEGGELRHRELAYDALESASELDARSVNPGVYSRAIEVSPFQPGSSPADRIESTIKKIRGNAKMGQLAYGPCILVVELGRLTLDAEHPSCLLPVYYNEGATADACASGELWHLAFGRIGETIYRLPEAEGMGNIDRPLEEDGILRAYPELLGISFILPRLSMPTKVYSIWNVSARLVAEGVGSNLAEQDVGDLINSYSDSMNDVRNSFGHRYVKRR